MPPGDATLKRYFQLMRHAEGDRLAAEALPLKRYDALL